MQQIADFLIVGGGSAGCALAARLSEDPGNRVVVVEAGRRDSWWDPFIHMPAGLSVPIGNRFYDWKYESEPEPFMNGRRVYHARGKVLGGSSSINGMIYIRGNAMDYENWAAESGLESWDYAHCLPYFRRAESRLEGDAGFRGAEGPLGLERGPCTNPLFQAFLEAAREAGYPATDDINGFRQEGFGPFDRNIRGGRRLSAARAYLHPVLDRPNLELRCRTQTMRILFEGTRAVGVEVARGRKREILRAGTVILASGAIGSPQLLQVSGVGPAEHLRSLGVEVRVDLPGVGENLQDHLEVYLQHRCTQPVSEQPALRWYNKPAVGLRWILGKTGPAATNHFEAGGFIRSNEDVGYPNVQFHFLPLAIRYDGSGPTGGHGYQVHVGPTLSDARGRLRIRSADANTKPSLLFNYLSTEKDRREWVESIRCARSILGQPALAPFDGGELSPGAAVESDEEILDWVRRDAETALHPSCTCRMGTGADAVVDPATMGVHGTDGLAVVDASVLPAVTNGNIYAPTMMIAERASDILLGRAPLAPDRREFHQVRRSGGEAAQREAGAA